MNLMKGNALPTFDVECPIFNAVPGIKLHVSI